MIPVSAHGTNPAVSIISMILTLSDFLQSAVLCGLKVVPIKTLQNGGLDLKDLRSKAESYKDRLAAFMVCIEISMIRNY